MTKERKAAIEQWETIRARIKSGEIFKKPDSGYAWQCNCWFCHYVRDHEAPGNDNGCTKCPLWKYTAAHCANVNLYTCGCSHYYHRTLYNKVTDESKRRKERLKACDLIIAALKGEHIWE